jgi:hypothetical protein
MLTPRDIWYRARDGQGSAWLVLLVRVTAAAVWLLFGMVFKVMGLLPRHQEIVAQILGAAAARPVTIVVGLAESALALWVLSGFLPRTCAVFQTIAIVSMNALELSYARSLLLAPLPMVLVNTAFLAFVWFAALWTAKRN